MGIKTREMSLAKDASQKILIWRRLYGKGLFMQNKILPGSLHFWFIRNGTQYDGTRPFRLFFKIPKGWPMQFAIFVQNMVRVVIKHKQL